MIVYTVRGGVVGGHLDRRRADVHLRRRRAGRLRRAAVADSRRLGDGRRCRRGGGQVQRLRLHAAIRRKVYTFWAGLFGGVALTLATHGTDQFLVQRLLSADVARSARSGLDAERLHRLRAVRAVPADRRRCSTPTTSTTPLPRPLPRNDEILPLFVVTALPHGAAGFIVAAIVAAALSPSINALAATTVNDFYLKYVRPDADEATLMRLSKARDDLLGRRPDRRRARRAVDRPVGARRRAVGAVAGRRPGARRVPRRACSRAASGRRAMLGGMAAGAVVADAVWWTGGVRHGRGTRCIGAGDSARVALGAVARATAAC